MGQFCTVGSSPAADYCARWDGIEPNHCRIGCRTSGGFVECFDPNVTIVHNGVERNRVRVKGGDRIKIGPIEFSVELPDKVEQKQSFGVSFDEEDDFEKAEDLASEEDDLKNVPVERESGDVTAGLWVNDPPPSEPLPIEDEDSNDFAAAEPEPNNASPEVQPLVEDLPSDAASEVPAEDKGEFKAPNPTKSTEKASKPVFEFDSVDASDLTVNGDDLAAIENMKGNSLVLQDMAFSSAEAFPESSVNQEASDSIDSSNTEEQDEMLANGDILAGGSFQQGKGWRWGGKHVAEMVGYLVESKQDLNCYRVLEHVNLSKCSLDEVKDVADKRAEVAIFLLSTQESAELLRFLLSKRWNERLAHPEALSMSLSLLPARNISSLFEHLDTIVLVQKGNVEMIRITNQLAPDG